MIHNPYSNNIQNYYKISNNSTVIINQDFDNEINENLFLILSSYSEVIFGSSFDKSVDKLPNSLNKITFGYSFNKNIDNLPNSVTHLVMGALFNKPIDNLPNSLISLTLGLYFNNSVDNLPNSLEYLIFNTESRFNLSLNSLPIKLIHLKIGANYCQKIYNLPNNLKYLEIGDYYLEHIIMLFEDNNLTNLNQLIFKSSYYMEFMERIYFISKYTDVINKVKQKHQKLTIQT